MKQGVFLRGVILFALMGDAYGQDRRVSAEEIKPLSTWKAGGEVFDLAFSPDGKTLVAGIGRSDQSQVIGHAAFGSPISRVPSEIRFWEVATGTHKLSITGNPPRNGLRFSPDGKTFASCSGIEKREMDEFLGGIVKIWESRTGKEKLRLDQDRIVTSTAFTPDGKTLATGSFDSTVRLWELPTGKPKAVLRGHRSVVHCVAFNSTGMTLASGGYDEIVCIWDVATGKKTATLEAKDPVGPGQGVFSLAFSPDDKLLACGVNHGVKVWNVAARQLAHVRLSKERCNSLSFSPDGKLLAWEGSDNIVRIWDLASGKENQLVGHSDHVYSIAFSPDGNLLISGSGDQTIRLWDVASMTKKQQ